MLEIDGRNVRISRGDTLDLSFDVEGVDMTGTRAIFSVKRTTESTRVEMAQPMEVSGSRLRVVIPAESMEHMEAGVYVYDICATNKEGRVTLNFPARFEVMEVAHIV